MSGSAFGLTSAGRSAAVLLLDRIGSEHCWNGDGGGGKADCVRGFVPQQPREERQIEETGQHHAFTEHRCDQMAVREPTQSPRGYRALRQVNKQVPSDRGTPLHSLFGVPLLM